MIYAKLTFIHPKTGKLEEHRVPGTSLCDINARAARIALVEGVTSFTLEQEETTSETGENHVIDWWADRGHNLVPEKLEVPTVYAAQESAV